MKKIKFTINNKEFIGNLNESKAASQLYDQLPITTSFTQKGGYEYYCVLPKPLSTDPVLLDFAEAGSIMLYLSSYLAVFYNDLEPVLEYTVLGKLESTDGLKAALDAGYNSITIEKA